MEDVECLRRNKHIVELLHRQYTQGGRLFWIEGDHRSGKTLFVDILTYKLFKVKKLVYTDINTIEDLESCFEKMRYFTPLPVVHVIENLDIDIHYTRDEQYKKVKLSDDVVSENINRLNLVIKKLFQSSKSIIITSLPKLNHRFKQIQKYFGTVRLEYDSINHTKTGFDERDMFLDKYTFFELLLTGTCYGHKVKIQKKDESKSISFSDYNRAFPSNIKQCKTISKPMNYVNYDHLDFAYLENGFKSLLSHPKVKLKDDTLENIANHYETLSFVDTLREFRDDVNHRYLNGIRTDIYTNSIKTLVPLIDKPNNWFIRY